MGAWVGRLIEELRVDRPVVIGHSMGSLVALWIAAHVEVAGVALIGPGEKMEVHSELQEAAGRGDPLAVDLIVGWTHTGTSRFGGHLEPGSWIPVLTERLLRRHLDGVLAVDLRAASCHDPVADADQVDVPVLVVIGSTDKMTPPKSGRALASYLSDAEVVEVVGGSHVAFLEQPAEVMPTLLSWLARVHPAS
jgi:pimeloyl-ACP methyl ester carboxylesterase